MIYACGCINEPDPDWGILKSIFKCDHHRRRSGRGGLSYYLDMGTVQNNVPQHFQYKKEMLEALSAMGAPAIARNPRGLALEVGCGLGVYAPMIMNLQYKYVGVEPDAQAAGWVRSTFCVDVEECTIEKIPDTYKGSADLVIAAHVLEHVTDAPAVVALLWGLLKPSGRLIVLVPDDTDPLNPDHRWFFKESQLRGLLKSHQFINLNSITLQIVKSEKFIYCSCFKGG